MGISTITVRDGDAPPASGFSVWCHGSYPGSALIDIDEAEAFVAAIAAIGKERSSALSYTTRDHLRISNSGPGKFVFWFARSSYLDAWRVESVPTNAEISAADLAKIEAAMEKELQALASAK
jgi:hypothetical protein